MIASADLNICLAISKHDFIVGAIQYLVFPKCSVFPLVYCHYKGKSAGTGVITDNSQLWQTCFYLDDH